MRFLAVLLAAALIPAFPADAQRARLSATRGEQVQAYRQARQGEILSLPEIRSRVHIRGAEYIGAEFDGRVYRLKYMRGAEVIWVDVDARTGRIVNRQ
jgi:hypothetical protein